MPSIEEPFGDPPPIRPPTLLPQVLACLAAALGAFVMGTAIGWSGPAISLMQRDDATLVFSNFTENNVSLSEFPLQNSSSKKNGFDEEVFSEEQDWPQWRKTSFNLSDSDANFVASLMPLGALFGGPASSMVIGRFGRRFAMMYTSAGFVLAYLLLSAAQNVWMVFLGRLLSGFCCGVTSIAAPLYIGETASAHVRGMLGSTFQLMVTFGILYVGCIGAFGSWRWMSVACAATCLVWAVALYFVPETPDFLLSQRKMDDAREALKFLRRHPDIDTELADLQTAIENRAASTNNSNTATFANLFRKRQNLKPLLISMVLMFGQQFSGVNAVIFFSVKIFEAAGTKLDSFVENIIVALVQVVGTIFAAGVIDCAGRRFLLMASAGVMAGAQIGLGTYFWLQVHDSSHASNLGFLPLVSLCFFIFFFAIGFGPIPWLMMGELFSPEMKGKASSVSACFNWSLAFLVTQFYGPIAVAVGSAATFWGFAVAMVIVFFVCMVFVPETKGKSLEEIQAMFSGGNVIEEDRRALVEEEEEEEEEELRDDDVGVEDEVARDLGGAGALRSVISVDA